MDIYECLSLLKEILDKCPDARGGDYLLMIPKTPHSSAEGYEIHLTKSHMDEQTRGCINRILEHKQLSVSQEPNSMLIYKTKKQVT